MGVYFEVFTCSCGTETANKVLIEKKQTGIVFSDLRTKVWKTITIVTIISGEAYASQHTILCNSGKKPKFVECKIRSIRSRLVVLLSGVFTPVR